jgi:hypothetical protein
MAVTSLVVNDDENSLGLNIVDGGSPARKKSIRSFLFAVNLS